MTIASALQRRMMLAVAPVAAPDGATALAVLFGDRENVVPVRTDRASYLLRPSWASMTL